MNCARVSHSQLIAHACRIIECAERPPSLDALASQLGVSSSHLHRVFKAQTGLTPKAYAAAHMARKLRQSLHFTSPEASASSVAPVTDAIYQAGFSSSSRFYEKADQMLGMRASAYRQGGVGATIRFAVGQCTLGPILVAQSQRGLCAILLGDDPETLVQDLQDQFPRAELIGGDPAFEQCVAQVIGFVEQPAIGLHLPLDVQGTAFQQRVWKALQQLPPGTTASYTDIACQIGAPAAVRAVAKACGANLLAVAIPCHRVVRRSGDLAGYRWGIDRKRELLRREADTPAASAEKTGF